MIWSDRSKFDGEWVNDARYKGKMYLTTGAIFKGKFKNEEFWGKGKLLFPDGTKLKAVFRDSSIPSIAKIYFPDFQLTYYGQHIDF